MEVVIASHNSHKVQELRNCLKEIAPTLQVLSLFDFPAYAPAMTENDLFEENAKVKALHAAAFLQKTCLADDSGIVVPALAKVGAQFTRRYQHAEQTARIQTKKLLEEMSALSGLERHAYLECSLAVATPQGEVKAVNQRSEGIIADSEKGKLTFEFDTLFIKHDYSKTLGELAPSVRMRISHRRKALEKLLAHIVRLAASSK